MAKTVEVALSIKIEIDDEYFPSDHAVDIVSNLRTMLCPAEIKLLDIRVSQGIDRRSDEA